MSNEISKWMNDIREGIWTAFGKSSVDIMNEWASVMISTMRVGGYIYPATSLGIRTGRLRDALLGVGDSVDDGRQEDEVIVYQRTVKVPYAEMYSKNSPTVVKMTPGMRAHLINMGVRLKDRKYFYMAFADEITHKGYNYVEEATNKIDNSKISNLIMDRVKVQLTRIPNLEITIGNK